MKFRYEFDVCRQVWDQWKICGDKLCIVAES